MTDRERVQEWREAPPPWSTTDGLTRLLWHDATQAFYALHRETGLYRSASGEHWVPLGSGLPASCNDFAFFVPLPVLGGLPVVLVATDAGVFRAHLSPAGAAFTQVSHGLPQGAPVLSIAWDGVAADGHGTLVCGVASNRRPGPVLFTTGDLGENWWATEAGYPAAGRREDDPVEILLANGCHVRTRGGRVHSAPQLGAWSAAPSLTDAISLGQAGAFTFAGGSAGEAGKLAKFHVDRGWQDVPVPAIPGALSRTAAGIPLVAGLRLNGIWQLWNWGSAEPDWRSDLNETFPKTPAGKPLGVVRVAIDRECRVICVEAWDHYAARLRMFVWGHR